MIKRTYLLMALMSACLNNYPKLKHIEEFRNSNSISYCAYDEYCYIAATYYISTKKYICSRTPYEKVEKKYKKIIPKQPQNYLIRHPRKEFEILRKAFKENNHLNF